jgi:hypothetical protein
MRQLLGYEFFTYDAEQTPLELDPAYGPEMTTKYNLKVAKLAWDIAQSIKGLDAAASVGTPAPAEVALKPTAYLAECSYDRREARETLEGELRIHGCVVLPDRPLPMEESEYVAAVTRMLDPCAVSIHLIGSGYGAVPDGQSQKSVVVLQHELALRRVAPWPLRRIIWLPEGTASTHVGQQAFIASLHDDPAFHREADLITGDLEALKAAVFSALQKLAEPATAVSRQAGQGSGAKLVYVVCDERDRQATIPIRKSLKARDIEVQIPVFVGDAATVRRANQDALSRCDAVIVLYGAGDEAWKRTVDNDLKKSSAYRGDRPMPTRFTYLAEPRSQDKDELIALEEPNLIDGLSGFREETLRPVLQVLDI